MATYILLAAAMSAVLFYLYFVHIRRGIPRKGIKSIEPNIVITEKCNGNCIYCLARGEKRLMSAEKIREVINAGFGTLMFEGGEPLLCADLEDWIRLSVRSGVSNIIVLTNGLLLTEERLKSLWEAGARHFHFNFPVHTKKEHEFLTSIPNMLERQTAAIKRASELSKEAAVLVCVVNSVNYKLLPDYVQYVSDNFPRIYYVEFNFIKVMGGVKDKHFLVPRLSDAAEYLDKALSLAKKLGIACLIDGFPLCFIPGWEAYTYDVHHLMRGDKTYLDEKASIEVCRKCSLSLICAGPRKDYVLIHGYCDFKASKASPESITSVLSSGTQLLLNKPDSVKKEHLTAKKTDYVSDNLRKK